MSLNEEIETIVSDPAKGYDEKLTILQRLVSKQEAVMLLGRNPKDEIILRDPLCGLPPLYLVIEKEWFDRIKDGSKKEEYRSLSDTTMSRYTYKGEDGRRYLKPYDRIRLCVGYHRQREEALVEIVGIVCDGDIVTYKLGRILSYKNKT